MTIFAVIELPYALLGLFVGILVGLTGVGGGSLMTPLLILLFGIHPATAVGTDLLFAGTTKSAGTLVNGINHSVDWRMTGLLACGSLPASALTLFLMSRMDLHDPTADAVIRDVLVAVLLLTSVSLLARRQALALAQRRLRDLSPAGTMALTILTGFVVGVLVSLTSIGAGAIGIVALLILYPRMPIARIVGSDIAHAVPLTLLAGFGHWLMGSVNWPMLGSLLVGSVPGIVAGSYASVHVPERLLRVVLAVTLAVVAIKTVF